MVHHRQINWLEALQIKRGMILKFIEEQPVLLPRIVRLFSVVSLILVTFSVSTNPAAASLFNSVDCEGYKNGASYTAKLSWVGPTRGAERVINFNLSILQNGGSLESNSAHFGDQLRYSRMFGAKGTVYGIYADSDGFIKTQNRQAVKQIFDFKFVHETQKLFVRSYSLKQWKEATQTWRMAENSKAWSDGGFLFNYGLEFECFES